MKTIFDVAKEVSSKFYHIHVDLIMIKTRKREIVQCRQIAMYLLKNYTKYSAKFIAQHFNGMDHSSVFHAKKVINNLRETNKKFALEFDTMEKKFLQESKIFFVSDNKLIALMDRIKEITNRQFWERIHKTINYLEEKREYLEVEFENLSKIDL